MTVGAYVIAPRPCPASCGSGARGRSGTRAECRAQRGPGRDAQLGEDPVQMGAHGAVRQVEPLADLTVRQAFGGQLGDVELMRGEPVAGVRIAVWARLAGGPELLPRPVAPRDGPERVERLASRTQVPAGLHGSAPAGAAAAEREQG